MTCNEICIHCMVYDYGIHTIIFMYVLYDSEYILPLFPEIFHIIYTWNIINRICTNKKVFCGIKNMEYMYET